jgi:Zn-dependent protease
MAVTGRQSRLSAGGFDGVPMSMAATRRATAAMVRPASMISPVFLALATVCCCAGASVWFGFGAQPFAVFLFVFSAWLVVVCLHEFAHAVAALRGGDESVIAKGYLTLSPMRYRHPMLTIVLPLVAMLFGGIPLPGGAVWIEGARLRGRLRDSLVSAAGPLVNVLCSAALLVLLSRVAGEPLPYFYTASGRLLTSPHAAFWAALSFFALVQVIVSVLNLLPLPGLDGYGIIEPWLPAGWRRTLTPIQPYLLLVVLALLFTHVVANEFSRLGDWVLGSAGVSPVNGEIGYVLAHFWH